MLVDVITQATDNSWLRLQHVDITGQQQALRLRGAALRVQGRIAQCESLAATLKAGAAALATFAGQDDAFYTDLARCG